MNLLLGEAHVVMQVLVVALLVVLPLSGCRDSSDSKGSGPDSAVAVGESATSNAGTTDNPNAAPGALVPDSVWLGDAWMRAGAAGATTGAYAVLYNTRSESVGIAGATSDVADTVEVHESMMHDGMVHMEPQASLTVPAMDSVVLAPGGKHFMVRKLQRALTPGETVTVRIVLRDGTVLDVPFAVRPVGG